MADTDGSVQMQTASGYLRFLTGGDAGTLGSNAVEKLRVTSDGKLGLNYNNPNTIIHAIGNSTVGTSVTSVSYTHLTLPTNREV